MTVREILVAARALYASSPDHSPLTVFPEDGTYCAYTAVGNAAAHGGEGWGAYGNAHDAVEVLRDAAGTRQLAIFNAAHSTEEVLDVFDRAIQAAS